MPELAILVVAFILAIVVVLTIASLFGRVTVFEYQRGLRFRDGRLVGLVDPGRHWIYRRSTLIQIVDVRQTILPVPGQEVVTADGISLRLSLAVRYRVADPVVAYTNVADVRGALHVVVQVALREIVGARPIDELLARREAIGAEVLERSTGPATELGIELLAVDVKDLMFPGPLKKVFAQVIEARQQGLAALEKARGETAALRSLANAARMVETNPSLIQLRLLQQLEATSGNTVVLGLPASSTPLPLASERTAAEPIGPEGQIAEHPPEE